MKQNSEKSGLVSEEVSSIRVLRKAKPLPTAGRALFRCPDNDSQTSCKASDSAGAERRCVER
ncbi:hypothetical protein BaRGS_00010809, partial [Batillaria attramentaria]